MVPPPVARVAASCTLAEADGGSFCLYLLCFGNIPPITRRVHAQPEAALTPLPVEAGMD
jgi:hypothetical protein